MSAAYRKSLAALKESPSVHLGIKVELGEYIAAGAFGVVHRAQCVEYGKIAAKLIPVALIAEEQITEYVLQEVSISRQLRHPHIVRTYDATVLTYEKCLGAGVRPAPAIVREEDGREFSIRGDCLAILMETAPGGDLLDKIMRSRRLDQNTARRYFQQLVSALIYMHSVNILHRDIKHENLLLGAQGDLKLCDMGMARNVVDGTAAPTQTATDLLVPAVLLTSNAGSVDYQAPEVLHTAGYFGFSADVWSAGVCLYIMLVGATPFAAPPAVSDQEERDRITERLILAGTFDHRNTFLPPQASELLVQMLTVDVDKRCSFYEVVQHPWFQQGLTKATMDDLDKRARRTYIERRLCASPTLSSPQQSLKYDAASSAASASAASGSPMNQSLLSLASPRGNSNTNITKQAPAEPTFEIKDDDDEEDDDDSRIAGAEAEGEGDAEDEEEIEEVEEVEGEEEQDTERSAARPPQLSKIADATTFLVSSERGQRVARDLFAAADRVAAANEKKRRSAESSSAPNSTPSSPFVPIPAPLEPELLAQQRFAGPEPAEEVAEDEDEAEEDAVAEEDETLSFNNDEEKQNHVADEEEEAAASDPTPEVENDDEELPNFYDATRSATPTGDEEQQPPQPQEVSEELEEEHRRSEEDETALMRPSSRAAGVLGGGAAEDEDEEEETQVATQQHQEEEAVSPILAEDARQTPSSRASSSSSPAAPQVEEEPSPQQQKEASDDSFNFSPQPQQEQRPAEQEHKEEEREERNSPTPPTPPTPEALPGGGGGGREEGEDQQDEQPHESSGVANVGEEEHGETVPAELPEQEQRQEEEQLQQEQREEEEEEVAKEEAAQQYQKLLPRKSSFDPQEENAEEHEEQMQPQEPPAPSTVDTSTVTLLEESHRSSNCAEEASARSALLQLLDLEAAEQQSRMTDVLLREHCAAALDVAVPMLSACFLAEQEQIVDSCAQATQREFPFLSTWSLQCAELAARREIEFESDLQVSIVWAEEVARGPAEEAALHDAEQERINARAWLAAAGTMERAWRDEQHERATFEDIEHMYLNQIWNEFVAAEVRVCGHKWEHSRAAEIAQDYYLGFYCALSAHYCDGISYQQHLEYFSETLEHQIRREILKQEAEEWELQVAAPTRQAVMDFFALMFSHGDDEDDEDADDVEELSSAPADGGNDSFAISEDDENTRQQQQQQSQPHASSSSHLHVEWSSNNIDGADDTVVDGADDDEIGVAAALRARNKQKQMDRKKSNMSNVSGMSSSSAAFGGKLINDARRVELEWQEILERAELIIEASRREKISLRFQSEYDNLAALCELGMTQMVEVVNRREFARWATGKRYDEFAKRSEQHCKIYCGTLFYFNHPNRQRGASFRSKRDGFASGSGASAAAAVSAAAATAANQEQQQAIPFHQQHSFMRGLLDLVEKQETAQRKILAHQIARDPQWLLLEVQHTERLEREALRAQSEVGYVSLFLLLKRYSMRDRLFDAQLVEVAKLKQDQVYENDLCILFGSLRLLQSAGRAFVARQELGRGSADARKAAHVLQRIGRGCIARSRLVIQAVHEKQRERLSNQEARSRDVGRSTEGSERQRLEYFISYTLSVYWHMQGSSNMSRRKQQAAQQKPPAASSRGQQYHHPGASSSSSTGWAGNSYAQHHWASSVSSSQQQQAAHPGALVFASSSSVHADSFGSRRGEQQHHLSTKSFVAPQRPASASAAGAARRPSDVNNRESLIPRRPASASDAAGGGRSYRQQQHQQQQEEAARCHDIDEEEQREEIGDDFAANSQQQQQQHRQQNQYQPRPPTPSYARPTAAYGSYTNTVSSSRRVTRFEKAAQQEREREQAEKQRKHKESNERYLAETKRRREQEAQRRADHQQQQPSSSPRATAGGGMRNSDVLFPVRESWSRLSSLGPAPEWKSASLYPSSKALPPWMK